MNHTILKLPETLPFRLVIEKKMAPTAKVSHCVDFKVIENLLNY